MMNVERALLIASVLSGVVGAVAPERAQAQDDPCSST
jgi:hypothetical protein